MLLQCVAPYMLAAEYCMLCRPLAAAPDVWSSSVSFYTDVWF